jgi:hypothetical protein
MGAADVRNACEEFARSRVAHPEGLSAKVEGIPDKLDVLIVFAEKRVRKPKAKS